MAEASPLPDTSFEAADHGEETSRKGRKKPWFTSHDEAPSPKRSRCESKLPAAAQKSPTTKSGLICSLKECSKVIAPLTEKYVEIKAGLPEGGLPRVSSTISWRVSGEAVFHDPCWKEVLRNARVRNPKRATINLSSAEKALIKEAAKTAEFHDSFSQVQREAARIATLIRKAKYCTAFTGAGISTSAGIGDYRGKAGKWTEMDREAATALVTDDLKDSNKPGLQNPTKSDTPEVKGNNDEVPYEQLRPTYTHEALAKLHEMGFLKHVISQNGDGLHELSGIPPEHLSELHGNVFLELCEECSHRYYRPFYVMDDNAGQYFEELEEYGTTNVPKPKHASQCKQCGLTHRTGRKCEQKGCNGFLKDSIINFGDDLEESILTSAERCAQQSDLCLSLGTTMRVTPACELVEMGKQPLQLVIVNRQPTHLDGLCYMEARGVQLGARVFGDCDQVMREVMKYLLSEEERLAWEDAQPLRMNHYDCLRAEP